MAPELPIDQSFFFQINKGDRTLRNMAAAIDGNTVNNILFPTYRGALGFLKGAEGATQEILTARNYGKLQSDVFFFDILDGSKKHVTSFNGALLFIKVAYKGNKTSLSQINVVMADWDLKTIKPISASDLLMISPANEDAEGYVIIKTTEPGYFVISDK